MSKERSLLLSKAVLGAAVALALALGASQATAGTRVTGSCNEEYPFAGSCVSSTDCTATCDARYPDHQHFGSCGDSGCCLCLNID